MAQTILITGCASGLGQALSQHLLAREHNVLAWTRQHLDLDNIDLVVRADIPRLDMLINCAAHDHQGRVPFLDHDCNMVYSILKVNLMAPMLLTQKVLHINPRCRIVNITSTNNRRYWPNDLGYSLSKIALAQFGDMLRLDHPNVDVLEVRLGLTKTNFNRNRYRSCPERYVDIYQQPCLDLDTVVNHLDSVLFDSNIKLVELAP